MKRVGRYRGRIFFKGGLMHVKLKSDQKINMRSKMIQPQEPNKTETKCWLLVQVYVCVHMDGCSILGAQDTV